MFLQERMSIIRLFKSLTKCDVNIHSTHTRIVTERTFNQWTALITSGSNWKITSTLIMNSTVLMMSGMWRGIFEQDSQYPVPIIPIQNFPTGTLDPGLLALCYWYCSTTTELIFSKECIMNIQGAPTNSYTDFQPKSVLEIQFYFLLVFWKVNAQFLHNFDQNMIIPALTGEKLDKISRKNIPITYLSKIRQLLVKNLFLVSDKLQIRHTSRLPCAEKKPSK